MVNAAELEQAFVDAGDAATRLLAEQLRDLRRRIEALEQPRPVPASRRRAERTRKTLDKSGNHGT